MIPALALTACAAELDQQKALQAGFQAHITKPVEPAVLVQAIVIFYRKRKQINVSSTWISMLETDQDTTGKGHE